MRVGAERIVHRFTKLQHDLAQSLQRLCGSCSNINEYDADDHVA
jgi:hypothetical protein